MNDPTTQRAEWGAVIVHLSGNDAVFMTGGTTPEPLLEDPYGSSSSSSSSRVADAAARSSGSSTAADRFITPEQAASIAMKVAISSLPNTSSPMIARLRAAAVRPNAKTLANANAATTTPRLMHCGKKLGCHAAYKQVVFLPPTSQTKTTELHVYVDATDGKLLSSANRLRTQYPASSGTGTGFYSGVVSLKTAYNANGKSTPFMLLDTLHNAETFDMKNKDDPRYQSNYDHYSTKWPDVLFKDKDNVW